MMLRLLKYVALGFCSACAVQNAPQGGPKDETPPVIREISPVIGALNYTGSTATVVFDEYIQAQKLRGVLVSSPPLTGLEFELKGKRLSFTWDENQMTDSTTYRISLGDEVGDLNENNRIKNLQFVWSTGPTIDSLQYHGSLNKKGEGAFDALSVWLVPSGIDSVSKAVFSTTPRKDGSFSFYYMPSDTFDLLVFEDLNFNKTWDVDMEPFGFQKNIFSLPDSFHTIIDYSALDFEIPILDSIVQDSIAYYIDTASEESLGTISFRIGPHEKMLHLWCTHSSNHQYLMTSSAHSDTLLSEPIILPPGDYTISGYQDLNENHVWDGPSWEDGTEGEPILESQVFDLKANWDIEQPIALPLKTEEDES